MSKRIVYRKGAYKFLRKQSEPTQRRIKNAIARIPAGDIKRLQGYDLYRLRVGSYRVLYRIENNVIIIENIGNCDDTYKRYRRKEKQRISKKNCAVIL